MPSKTSLVWKLGMIALVLEEMVLVAVAVVMVGLETGLGLSAGLGLAGLGEAFALLGVLWGTNFPLEKCDSCLLIGKYESTANIQPLLVPYPETRTDSSVRGWCQEWLEKWTAIPRSLNPALRLNLRAAEIQCRSPD